MWTKYRPEQGKLSEGFYFDPHLKIKRDYSLLLLSLFLAALHSICSSSQPCWFTTATCTQDISSRTAVALPRLTSPSVLSGFGCRTTRCEKPACTRSCLPTLTCFSTSGCKDWTWFCTQKNNQQLWGSRGSQRLWYSLCRISADDGETKVTFSFWVQKEEEEDPNPKEYGLARFSSWFGTCDLLLFSKHFDIWDITEERLNIEDVWSRRFFQFSGPQGVPGFCLVF